MVAVSRPAYSESQPPQTPGLAVSIRHPGRTAKVLVVENEAVIAEDLAEWLCDLGYRVRGPVDSAGKAMQALESEKIDIVLMDISLEGGSEGIEASIEIGRRFHTPVIYLSGCASPDVLAGLVCSRPFGLVAKPYDPAYLASVLSRVLQGPGAMAGAESRG